MSELKLEVGQYWQQVSGDDAGRVVKVLKVNSWAAAHVREIKGYQAGEEKLNFYILGGLEDFVLLNEQPCTKEKILQIDVYLEDKGFTVVNVEVTENKVNLEEELIKDNVGSMVMDLGLQQHLDKQSLRNELKSIIEMSDSDNAVEELIRKYNLG